MECMECKFRKFDNYVEGSLRAVYTCGHPEGETVSIKSDGEFCPLDVISIEPWTDTQYLEWVAENVTEIDTSSFFKDGTIKVNWMDRLGFHSTCGNGDTIENALKAAIDKTREV